MPRYERELEAAVSAVHAGLSVAREQIGKTQATIKTGVDLVTEADLAAEDAIRTVLSACLPEIAIVGEERGGEPSTYGEAYWLIDPICGTRNYASQLPVFGTNLALVEGNVVRLGVVGDGTNGRIYAAESGRTAFLASDPRRPALQVRPGTVIALELAGKPPFTGDTAAVGRLLAQLIGDGRYYVRLQGTTLPFAKLATGDYAAVVLIGSGPADPLHTAAGCTLADSAGAIVTDEQGKPWHLQSASLIGAATAELHKYLIESWKRCLEAA